MSGELNSLGAITEKDLPDDRRNLGTKRSSHPEDWSDLIEREYREKVCQKDRREQDH